MIQRSSTESVPEEADRRDVQRRYDAVEAAASVWSGDRTPVAHGPCPPSRWDRD